MVIRTCEDDMKSKDKKRRVNAFIYRMLELTKAAVVSLNYTFQIPLHVMDMNLESYKEFDRKWRRKKMPQLEIRRANANKPFCRYRFAVVEFFEGPHGRHWWTWYNSTRTVTALIIQGLVTIPRYSC